MAAFVVYEAASSDLSLVYILESKHIHKSLFFLVIKSARSREVFWILIGSEHHVPPYDVTVVILMAGIFVMNAVHLRTLKEISDPSRRLHIRVIEKLTKRCTEGINSSAF